MGNESNKKDYEFGYGKTPVETRFKKGQSGNPRGRPKSSKSRRAVIDEVLDTKVLVTIGGKRRRVTKWHLIVETAVNEAVVSKNFKLLEILGVFKEVEEKREYPLTFTLDLDSRRPANDWSDDDFDYTQPQLKPGGSTAPG